MGEPSFDTETTRAMMQQEIAEQAARIKELEAACRKAEHRMTQDGYQPEHSGGDALVGLREVLAKSSC